MFVEYETEVQEERGRVKALLDKLRIDAELVVFWLASGNLSTYEAIIHGRFKSPETENIVNECLKNQDWWDDLQDYRGRRSMTRFQEFASIAHVMESTSGRPGLYNPHADSANDTKKRRRHSMAQFAELPKKPTMSQLVKLGVSMGIHTQNLFSVFDSSDSDVGYDSGSDSDLSEVTDEPFTDAESTSGDGIEPATHPLLASIRRRRSFADIFARAKSPRRGRRSRRGFSPGPSSPGPGSYGTMSIDQRLGSDAGSENVRNGGSASEPFAGPRGILKQDRPALSRHSSTAMRFTSNVVPQTTITNEDGTGPRIMFAETETRVERPPLSRQSSYGRLTGEQTPREQNAADRKVSFADSGSGVKSPAISRRSSVSRTPENGGDASVNIPGLLASYPLPEDDENSGSSYSTQGFSLSFNDLPSRAQHLILNELMRQNSRDTAVMLTTLPIPEENTGQSEEASLAYLSDIEVLCNGLPPVLLVLSNHMTVTVSL